jgi:hypothetical protein
MPEMNSIVAVYETNVDAEQGVRDLHNAGFDMMKLSIVAKEYRPEEYTAHDDHLEYPGKRGGILGGIGGFLAGATYFVLPSIGPVLMTGPLVPAFVDGMEGAEAGAGLSAFGTGLCGLGIPERSIPRYESELGADRLLLIAHGTAQELLQAKDVLHQTRPAEVNVHFAPELARASG